jgi:type IV pilus assembly protein PilN
VTTQTVQSASPVVMPQVNLMPPEIAEAERLHRLQRAMVGAVVVSALLVGGLYWHTKQGVSSAQNQLTAAQAQHSSLQVKYNGLDDVQQVFTQVQAKQLLVQQAMGQEVRWSFVLNDLTTAVPNNVWLTGITATESALPGSSAPPTVGADGTTAGIGSIVFTGLGFRHNDVANWLDAMAGVKGFADPSFTASVKGVITPKSVVNWTSTVVLSATALSNRYTPKAGS